MVKKRKGKTKAFYDFEFTGLHQGTTPISLGIVTSNGYSFYAEFTDYDHNQVDDWIKENVIANLTLPDEAPFNHEVGSVTLVKGDKYYVKLNLLSWLTRFTEVEFWGDCSWYDGVLLNEVLGGALNLPENVNYIFFDISTLFRVHGIDPDIDREAFVDRPVEGPKHNAMNDAILIQACYDKLYRNFEDYNIVP